jgi:hypothetical protein
MDDDLEIEGEFHMSFFFARQFSLGAEVTYVHT